MSDAVAADIDPTASSLPAWWDRVEFVSLDTDDRHCPQHFDLTGPPRCLIYGPYRRLEPGLWRAVVPLELCPDAGRRQLAVQFGIHPNYTTVDLPYGVPGRHDVQIDFPVVEAGHAEVRVLLKRAAFHGELRFAGVSVQRLGDTAGTVAPG